MFQPLLRPTDLQLLLLITAARHPNGLILPPPDNVGGQAERIRQAAEAMLRHGLVAEQAVPAGPTAWRQEPTGAIGLHITSQGRLLAGSPMPIVAEAGGEAKVSAEPAPTELKPVVVALALLSRGGGATLAELSAATGWLPHSARAALSGMRKRGHDVQRGTRSDATCYFVRQMAS